MTWQFLQFHEPGPATWFYLSLLLAIAIYVRFGRLWSLRNWDIVSLFLVVPGLLATVEVERVVQEESVLPSQSADVNMANPQQPANMSDAEKLAANPQWQQMARFGYIWLFAITAYFLLRTLLDIALVRRPRLEQNLSPGGLIFLAVCLFAYLAFIVVTREPDARARTDARVASSLLEGQTRPKATGGADPATVLFMLPPAAVHRAIAGANPDALPTEQSEVEDGIVRSAVILCHLLIMAGLLLVGWQHFQSIATGIAIVAIYLLLPVSFLHVMKLDHLIPSMLIVWSVFLYRVPLVAGGLMGVAAVAFFPLFLLPAWISFYWRRGAKRFSIGFLTTTVILWTLVYFVPTLLSFFDVWATSLSTRVLMTSGEDLQAIGFWTAATQIYRLPIAILFAILVIGSFFVPKQKTLADLLALSLAVLLMVQFWWADRGGTLIHWYLPLLLLVIFRPNLSESFAPKAPTPVPEPT